MEDGKAGKCHPPSPSYGATRGNECQGNKTNGTDGELTGRGLFPALRACAGRILPEAALDRAYVSHAGTFNHRF